MQIDSGTLLWALGIITTLTGATFVYTLGNERRLTTLETKIEVFWSSMGKAAANILHSPHRPELDGLLERYQDGQLGREDLTRLVIWLTEIEGDKSGEYNHGERFAAATLRTTIIHRYDLRGAWR